MVTGMHTDPCGNRRIFGKRLTLRPFKGPIQLSAPKCTFAWIQRVELMVQVGDRIASLTWELLLTTLFLAHRNKLPADAEVMLISPWISDVQNEQFALPTPSAMKFQTKWGEI